ncbi:hypothetical protein UC41_20120 [Escherichia coli]|nr:hypothetical protein UC41_20120 [Escherichia coli]
MNAIIPKKRRDGKSSFEDLIAYTSVRVRQQLPVGVGPDDRMPPGSREPKGVPASGNQNNRNDITEKCLTP